MTYNIVTKYPIILEIKKCKHFKMSLGLAVSIDDKGNRVLNHNDKFGYFYASKYRTTIYKQGVIGDLNFFTDPYIKDEIIVAYIDSEEFVINFDKSIINDKGIDFYIGHILKTIENEYEERSKVMESKKIVIERGANPDIVLTNPGAATHEDIKAYIAKKNENRFNR